MKKKATPKKAKADDFNYFTFGKASQDFIKAIAQGRRPNAKARKALAHACRSLSRL